MATLVPVLSPRECPNAALDCDGITDDEEVDAVVDVDDVGEVEDEVGVGVANVVEIWVGVGEGELEDGVEVGGPTTIVGGNVDPPNVKSDPSGIYKDLIKREQMTRKKVQRTLGPKYPKGMNRMLVSTTWAPFTCVVIGTGVSQGGKTWVGAVILAKI